MKRRLTGRDVEPLIEMSYAISSGEGDVQFSVLIGALVLVAKARKLERHILHRALDATWDFDHSKPQENIIDLTDH